MENSRLRQAASTSVNVTVGKRSREYLTDREVERLIEAAKQNRSGHRDATAKQHHLTVRKFECIVMSDQPLFVDLAKDCCLVIDHPTPGEKTGRFAHNLVGKGQLCSGQNANSYIGIFRRAESSRSRTKVSRGELICDLGRPGADTLKAIITHSALSCCPAL
jgi:hypothetical protein